MGSIGNGTQTLEALNGKMGEKWLPYDRTVLDEWLLSMVTYAAESPQNQPLSSVVLEFRDLIESDTEIFMHATSMFDQIPNEAPYNQDSLGRTQIRDYRHMLHLMDAVLTSAPKWDDFVATIGWVGFPLNVLLNWPMSTPSGKAFFLNRKVNAVLGKILNAWGDYLSSEASANVLTTEKGGWLSGSAVEAVNKVANAGKTELSFKELFVCDQSLPHWGYKSWDHFFTRQLQPGVRPVEAPEDNSIIISACESKPYRLSKDVARRDTFWVKGQPYSLVDMLDHDPLAENFIGGTVYQAFLSGLSYHRWHSPISGTIIKCHKTAGTYYSKALSQDFGSNRTSLSPSQGYLAEVATRAFVYIQADNPAIGLMCVIPIGMAEVSTCDITVEVGQHVNKGEELGMFHYGGSTYCLVFRPETVLEWTPEASGTVALTGNIPLNSQIARVL
ncbi:L-tryptophan decarboxylase [Cladobotryum mycophilum]|uniref:L-tryptophan decarboxylase n=1 Tax=Cladobotryum mycophilum TaxID=491253 RepID=A0ABR0SI32_9HYPO